MNRGFPRAGWPAIGLRLLVAGLLVAGAALQTLSVRLGDSPRVIVSDAKYYYAWVRSVALDGDLQFRNDYALLAPPDLPPPEYDRPTPRSDAANKYPVGLPIVETPGFAVGHVVALALPSVPADGLSLPYQFAVAGSLLLYALIGIVLLRTAMVRWGVGEGPATVLTVFVVLGTNLIHYVAKEPAMPHAAGFAITCLAMFLISGPCPASARAGAVRDLGLGLLVGLLLLVRNSNVALIPFLATMFVLRRGVSARSALVAVGVLAVVALQPLSLHLLWGDFRLTTYPDEGFAFVPARLVASLFHARHGLFLYSPWYLVLLAILGVGVVRSRETRTLAAAALVSFACLWMINGSWNMWWFGASFGSRAYIEVLPVLTLAAGVVLSRIGPSRRVTRSGIGIGVAACLLNLYIWSGYLLHRFPHEEQDTVGEVYGWALGNRD